MYVLEEYLLWSLIYRDYIALILNPQLFMCVTLSMWKPWTIFIDFYDKFIFNCFAMYYALFIIIIDPLELHSNEEKKENYYYWIRLHFHSFLLRIFFFSLFLFILFIPTYLNIHISKENEFLLLSRESLRFVFLHSLPYVCLVLRNSHCQWYAWTHFVKLENNCGAVCVYVDTYVLKILSIHLKILKPHQQMARYRVDGHVKSSLSDSFKRWEGFWEEFWIFWGRFH